MRTLARRSFLAATGSAALLGPAASAPRAAAGHEPAQGSLVLGGGGRPYARDLLDTFWHLAGREKARIVVVPTAHPEMDSPRTVARRVELVSSPWLKRGVREVVLRHTLSAEEANEQAFVAPLAEATGVWLGGGDQSRLLAAYAGTLFLRELQAVLRRGGVIGGSSAGTAVQSELTIVGEQGERPLVAPGFNLLPGTIVDQHFLARSRQGRLQQAVSEHPDLFGLGIDEHTALVVRAGSMQVIGKSTVSAFWSPERDRIASRTFRAGEKIDLHQLRKQG